MIAKEVETLRGEDGRLPSCAWPGGYPILYVCADGGVLCSDCANGDNGSEAPIAEEWDKGWLVEAYDVYYEGPPTYCDHCNAEIESAYGDPDAEEVVV